MRRIATAGAVASAGALVWSAVALGSGATLYASPASGAATSGTCPASAPCSLSTAISLANAGDTVIALPGTYNLTSGVSVSKAITVEGQPGQPRPSLVGAGADTVDASAGAVIAHLDIQATSALTTALSLDGATGQDLTLSTGPNATQAEALSVQDSAAGTLVRTVLAVNAASQGEAVSFHDSKSGAGTATALNLTAVNTGSGGDAISGDVVSGTITVKDAIAYGAGDDISTKPGTQALDVSYSDFATSASGSVAPGGAGNISATPLFVNGYHEAAGSPTIGAGSSDPSMTAADLDGNAWPSALPDMGAYQYTGADGGSTGSNTGGTTTGELPPPSPPVPGRSVTLRRGSGRVEVKLPGSHRFVALAGAAQLPVGAVIDATHGHVVLTSAVNHAGATRTGNFTRGSFAITQTRAAHPLTDLRLVGGSFAGCTAGHASTAFQRFLVARHRPRRHPRHHVVRQLWGSDQGGRFVTIGRSASAAVRGTVWLTQDRCDGTLVRVFRGRVLVHPRGHRHSVMVSAGHSYLSRVGG
ncbi:MAG: hypothetical protein ACRDVE_06535 [Actinocrinis sp.]